MDGKTYQTKIRTTLERCAALKKVVHKFPDTCAVGCAQVMLVHGGQRQDSVCTTPAHHFSAHKGLNARAQLTAHNCAHKAGAQDRRTRLRTTPRTTLHSLVRTRPAHKAESCVHKFCFLYIMLS